MRPAGLLRDPEDVLGKVFLRVLRVGKFFVKQLCPLGLEDVRDVLDEDRAERDVLVVGGLHVAVELVGRGPELGLEAEVSLGVIRLFFHVVLVRGQLSLVAAGNRKVPESATGSIGLATAKLSASLARRATRRQFLFAE